MVEIPTVIKIHFVIPDDDGDLFDAHTHGLEAFGHPEFQILVPGFCRGWAGSILNNHADRVINRGEVFRGGDTGEIGGAFVAYIKVPGDFSGDPTRLRIVDMPSAYKRGPRRVEPTPFGRFKEN